MPQYLGAVPLVNVFETVSFCLHRLGEFNQIANCCGTLSRVEMNLVPTKHDGLDCALCSILSFLVCIAVKNRLNLFPKAAVYTYFHYEFIYRLAV